RHVAAQAEDVHRRLTNITLRMGLWILARTESRMMRAYPQADLTRRNREKSATFAPGASFYKLFLLSFIGSFLGDVVETIFCKLPGGEGRTGSGLWGGRFPLVGAWRLAWAPWLCTANKTKPAAGCLGPGTCWAAPMNTCAACSACWCSARSF